MCDLGEYLDYKNCKCRERVVDKLVNECNENIDEEVKILDKNENKCCSCTLYLVLFSTCFTINTGIAAYYFYYKQMNCNKENVSVYEYVCYTKKLVIK